MPQSPLPLQLYRKQATITSRERLHTANNFGELTPAALRQILDDAKDGDIEQWIELCKHMLATDPNLFDCIDIRKKRALTEFSKRKILPGRDMDPAIQAYSGKAAQFCETMMGNIRPLKPKILKVLSAIEQGVSTTQLHWGRDSGANVITDLEWVHARRFRWDSEWRLRLYDYGERVSQCEYGEELEPYLWLIHLSEEDASYPGEAGILRKCAWPWNFKMWVNRFYIHATERYGQPFVYAKTPPGAKSSVDSSVLSKLEQLSYDTVGVFEEGTEIVFEGGPSTLNNGEMFEKFLNRADGNETKAILGAADITDPGVHGSQSAVETRAEETLDPKTDIDVDLLCSSIESQIYEPVLLFNRHLFGGFVPSTPRYETAEEYRERIRARNVVQGYPQQNPETLPQEQSVEFSQPEPIKKKVTSPMKRSHSRTETQLTFKYSTNPLEKALLGESVG